MEHLLETIDNVRQNSPPPPCPVDIVLITSVLYTLGGAHPMSRSVFTHEQRFEQTKKTIQSIRDKIPRAYIIMVECSPLTAEHDAYLEGAVDVFFNLWNTSLRDRIFTHSKALGEATQTLYALDYIYENKIKFCNYWKISGRYFLDDRFSYQAWTSAGTMGDSIFIKEWNAAQSVFTFFMKIPADLVPVWQKHLREHHDECVAGRVGYEVIYGRFIEKNAQRVRFIDIMGVYGWISPSGDLVCV